MNDYAVLRGIENIGDAMQSDQLEFNLLSFFQWGLLGVGSYFNVTVGTSGAYGGNQSALRCSEDPNYVTGQVWEAFRKDWVWETGVYYPIQPIRVSGVYVNGAFQPLNSSGVYSHAVDYPLGRVIFNSPIPPSSQVACEYSYRLYQFYPADVPWWQQLQLNSFRVDDPQFLQSGSGAWSIDGQSRIQLPAVIVEADMRTEQFPFEIGSYNQTLRQDINFHILAETRPDMKCIHDIIINQQEKRLNGVDKNTLLQADAFPLDDSGSPTPSGLMYPDLSSDSSPYFWRQIRFHKMRSYSQPRLGPVFYSVVKLTAEVDLP